MPPLSALGTPPSRRLARRRPAAVESETLSGQPARTPAFHGGRPKGRLKAARRPRSLCGRRQAAALQGGFAAP